MRTARPRPSVATAVAGALVLAGVAAAAGATPVAAVTPAVAVGPAAVGPAAVGPAAVAPVAVAGRAAGTAPTRSGHRVGAALVGAAAVARARSVRSRMTLAQEVGQLVMAGVPATDPARAAALVATYHLGGVFLAGRSYAGVAVTAAGVRRLRSVAVPAAGTAIWVATDQEGGFVQVLNGPGFSRIPSAATQSTSTFAGLRASSATWAGQLARTGVDVDLAPVADVVPGNPAANPPIGYYGRQYGRSIGDVVWAVRAVVPGYASAGVTATVKHFPGLGRVTANTDTHVDVVDAVTTRSGANESPFRAALTAGAGLLMVSSARYTRIDARHQAVFSPTVIGGMIRGDLRWQGVVISDDLGAAASVAAVPVGSRAVSFVAAGGDVVLTVDPRLVPAMATALIAHARGVPAFRAQVDASVLRVLTRKAQQGLLPR